jgi:hypothetical protein
MRLSALSISLINKDSSLKVVPLGSDTIEQSINAYTALHRTRQATPCPQLKALGALGIEKGKKG